MCIRIGENPDSHEPQNPLVAPTIHKILRIKVLRTAHGLYSGFRLGRWLGSVRNIAKGASCLVSLEG